MPDSQPTAPRPRRWRAKAAMTLAGAAAITALATVPALSASAASVPAKAAVSAVTHHGTSQQPATRPHRSSHPAAVPGTNAGMPPTAQSLYAVINSNGTVARGFQATGAANLSPGDYEVDFSQNITGCAYIGTIGLTGSVGISPPGQIAVVGRTGNANAVFVQTFNAVGTPADLSFHLAVLC